MGIRLQSPIVLTGRMRRRTRLLAVTAVGVVAAGAPGSLTG